MARLQRHLVEEPPITHDLLRQVTSMAQPLEKATVLSTLIKRIGNAHHVLLGEASHGTSEYYAWRTQITKQLIVDKEFNFIAVEGDWPDCYRLNRYIKGYPHSGGSAKEVLTANFRRWPTWMWANEEVVELIEWLRKYNHDLPLESKVGFYGLDVYSLWESLAVLAAHLKHDSPESMTVLRDVVQCFEPFGEDVYAYARAAAFHVASCETKARKLLEHLQERLKALPENEERERIFQCEQNAIVIRNAERYYRAMVQPGSSSWNIRDHHMSETLERLMVHHGSEAKGIVWEHNTHIGDARYTDMHARGEINVGQLARERHGRDDVVLIGFSSYKGTVIAGKSWDAPIEVMTLPPARRGSWEDVLHRVKVPHSLYIFSPNKQNDELNEIRGHRAVGVVYQPQYEHLGNYVPSVLPQRYDALIFLDETKALKPLKVAAQYEREPSDTYPFAL